MVAAHVEVERWTRCPARDCAHEAKHAEPGRTVDAVADVCYDCLAVVLGNVAQAALPDTLDNALQDRALDLIVFWARNVSANELAALAEKQARKAGGV
jgi:hypothetical protein